MPSQCDGGGEALDQGRPGQATWTSPVKTSLTWTSPMWGDVRQGPGAQEWPDGSRYEGEYLNGLRHGPGRFTWRNGEVRAGLRSGLRSEDPDRPGHVLLMLFQS